MKRLRRGSVSLVATWAVLAACSTTPVTHRRALNFIPEQQMQALGAQAFAEMKSQEKPLSEGAVVERVRAIGRRIATASGKNYEWEFSVFDEPKVVNAFCLPGGKVGVYTGILPFAKTDAGLAAILGHEVAHATLGHGGERLSQALTMQVGLQLAAVSLGDTKYREPILAALGIGGQLGILLPYSRLHESEADLAGLHYMAAAGYEPGEAIEVWKRMAKAGDRPPEILSTHPDPEKRAAFLKENLEKVMPEYERSEKQPSRELP